MESKQDLIKPSEIKEEPLDDLTEKKIDVSQSLKSSATKLGLKNEMKRESKDESLTGRFSEKELNIKKEPYENFSPTNSKGACPICGQEQGNSKTQMIRHLGS